MSVLPTEILFDSPSCPITRTGITRFSDEKSKTKAMVFESKERLKKLPGDPF
jgi:hypothetical protein